MSLARATIALIGTCDTKLEELLFLRSQILAQPNTEVILIDVGRSPSNNSAITISHLDLFFRYGSFKTPTSVSDLSRNEVLDMMSSLATKCISQLHHEQKIHGIISAGGSGGTSLASTVMRDALPIGFPKLIVSTVASGDTGPIVGETDITLMYSVVDISGLNTLLRTVLNNAASAIVGMSRYQIERSVTSNTKKEGEKKLKIGITMFGVTTPCVDIARKYLSTHLPAAEIYIFHATGHGGLAMERLISENQLDAILDITTTEICDYLIGGNMSAGPHRLEAALKAGIPNIISLGATDMVNFGPRETNVPEKFAGRRLLVHNANVTLMRTTGDEGRKVGGFIVRKVREFAREEGMVQVWIPKGGVSLIDTSGGPFEDRDADEALFDTVRSGLKGTDVKVVDHDGAVNDEAFAVAITNELIRLIILRGELS